MRVTPAQPTKSPGPLAGLRVVEFAGLGPAPFACMLLADLCADGVLVERSGMPAPDPLQLVNRGRSVVQADLKSTPDREHVLVGDYGGGILYLAVGVLSALFEAQASGRGQVVDAAITDGTVHLRTQLLTQHQRGRLSAQREDNMLDGEAPWYGVHETADERFVAIGAIEPAFVSLLIERLGLDDSGRAMQNDRASWPAMREAIATAVRARTRDAWTTSFEGADACLSPVLTLAEAPTHPHNAARRNFVQVDGVIHPAPTPRLSGSSPGGAPIRAATASTLAATLDRWATRP